MLPVGEHTIIGEDNEAVAPLQGLLLTRVQVQVVISLAYIPAHHSLLEAAPHIPKPHTHPQLTYSLCSRRHALTVGHSNKKLQ